MISFLRRLSVTFNRSQLLDFWLNDRARVIHHTSPGRLFIPLITTWKLDLRSGAFSVEGTGQVQLAMLADEDQRIGFDVGATLPITSPDRIVQMQPWSESVDYYSTQVGRPIILHPDGELEGLSGGGARASLTVTVDYLERNV